jgi:hypothetical protein
LFGVCLAIFAERIWANGLVGKHKLRQFHAPRPLSGRSQSWRDPILICVIS